MEMMNVFNGEHTLFKYKRTVGFYIKKRTWRKRLNGYEQGSGRVELNYSLWSVLHCIIQSLFVVLNAVCVFGFRCGKS